ncbi:MAG: T9SS C-terminal target domain-containing protein [Cytophagales bacterium]|nr:MAG: T9SS C-terminal target domain-containing protein [Cytophagales bacterium]
MKVHILFGSVFLMIMSTHFARAQEIRCLTQEYAQIYHIANTPTQLPKQSLNPHQLNSETIYILPVVVHIIHNGEPEGVGTNLSKAQIESQIRVLNEDFRRQIGTRGFNNHPNGADTKINFELASIDPQGNPTDGIVRKKGKNTAWSLSDDIELKSTSYWNAEEYVNIWVCDLVGFLGYAQFPESNLQGLEEASKNPLTDGIVIDYQRFGDEGNLLPPFNLGRTATHEMAHFLGLRHIWGDIDGCSGTDFCNDTPPAFTSNTGCPTQRRSDCDPNLPEMFENYMDYTHDACMNIFTNDQKNRMRYVLENSIRRKTLLNSPALTPKIVTANDAGIERIITISGEDCNITIQPVISLRNYGSAALQNVVIELWLNGIKQYQSLWQGNLSSLERTTLTLPTVNVRKGSYQVEIKAQSPNNTTDLNPNNDQRNTSIEIKNTLSTKNQENFENYSPSNSDWTIENNDQLIGWEVKKINNNQVLWLNAAQYRTLNAQDKIFSANLSLFSFQKPIFSFDVAYAPTKDNLNSNQERLQIWLYEQCGKQPLELLYDKTATQLITTNLRQNDWTPSSESQWRRETIDLSKWVNKKNIQIVFVSTNGYGNNLFLDNFSLQDLPQQSSIILYPNPTQNIAYVYFSLQKTEKITLQMYDEQGKNIITEQFVSPTLYTHTLIIPPHQKGIFIVEIVGESFQETKKIVVR